MNILLTNDDSAQSPLLDLTIEKSSHLGNLKVIVPEFEQSWKGKSITCGDSLTLKELPDKKVEAYTLNGTPADCANAGIYQLFEDKPELVISGVNTGENTGISFTFSSGTIGACFEANIAKVPAIALSQKLSNEVYKHYAVNRILPKDAAIKLNDQLGKALDLCFDFFLKNKELLAEPITWSVNFPFDLASDVKICFASLGISYYGKLFSQNGDILKHALRDVFEDQAAESDIQQIERGNITITPLDIRSFGQIELAEKERLTKLFANHQSRS